MTKAREKILAKLKTRKSKARISRLQRQPVNKPHLIVEDQVSHFCRQLEANHIEVIHNTGDTWQQQLTQLAEQKNLNRWLLGSGLAYQELAIKALNDCPTVEQITRYNTKYEQLKENLFHEVDASITLAHAGISETGSLLLVPDHHEPRTMSLIPPVHVVLLKTSQIVTTLDIALAETANLDMTATNILVISSPSKTADIQQTLAYGAHGPKELIVIIDDYENVRTLRDQTPLD